jgi:shikimate dehydrogenase
MTSSTDPDSLDRYAVVGNPVAHSQSPFIHGEFARQTGEPVAYGRLHCELGAFADTVRAFAAGGGRGCNITVPFKFEAPALAAVVTPRAALAQAANILRFDAGGWLADNTDGVGLLRDIEVHAGLPLAGRRVLLVGAGGAAAGVLGPLLDARPAELVVVNRTAERALAMVERHAEVARRTGVRLTVGALHAPGSSFDLVINASASSLQGAAVPVPTSVLAPGALAIDLMYGTAAAPFLAWARDAGAVGRDGLGMLVEQAAEAFFVWRGVRPLTPPVLTALRERLALPLAKPA